MSILIIARNFRDAAECARREAVQGKWIAVTPGDYSDALAGLAVPRQQVIWNESLETFGPDMLEAIGACIRRSIRP